MECEHRRWVNDHCEDCHVNRDEAACDWLSEIHRLTAERDAALAEVERLRRELIQIHIRGIGEEQR